MSQIQTGCVQYLFFFPPASFKLLHQSGAEHSSRLNIQMVDVFLPKGEKHSFWKMVTNIKKSTGKKA